MFPKDNMRKLRLALAIIGMLASNAEAQQATDPRGVDLVRAGAIRIGVFPSFQYSEDSATGQPRGLAIGIGRALASHLGLVDVVTVKFATAQKVVDCVKSGGCDFGFLLIDPARAAEVEFTPAFARSDFTYLLPAGSPIRGAAEADRPGIRIAVVRGHASTAAWLRVAMHATPVYADTFESAVDLLRNGQADAFASNREILLEYSSHLSGSRVLEDSYQSGFAGVAVAKGNAGRLAFVSEFLDDMKRSGLLQRIIDDLGLRGIEVVPPKR
jgi:polar amino acid transport system substrate-binding protein